MTDQQALEIVGPFLAAWPRPTVSPETITIYVRALQDLDADVLRTATVRCSQTRKFLPTIAEVREECARLQSGGMLNPEEAWALVMQAFRKVGGYRPFPANTVGGELLKRAVDMIGWEEMCRSTNVEATRAHFFRIYAAAVARRIESIATGSTEPVLRLAHSAPAPKQVVDGTR